MNLVEACKVEIPSVEDVKGSRFYRKLVEKIDFVDFARGYEDQRRNTAA